MMLGIPTFGLISRCIAGLAMTAFACAAVTGAISPRSALSAEARAFSALTGSWSGGGTIKLSSGSAERIRCRSDDETRGVDLMLRLRCASDSYSFDLTATVRYEGGAISGSWSEASRSVSGSIAGRSNPNGSEIQVTAQSPAFTANLIISTRGARQSITISTPGTQVSEVMVALERR
jgi:hypothetical protein